MSDSPQQQSNPGPDPLEEKPAKAGPRAGSGGRSAKPDSARTKAMGWSVAVIGMEMAGSVLIMTWAGWWLDNRYETTPWLTLLGAGLGIGGGFFALFAQVRRMTPRR